MAVFIVSMCLFFYTLLDFVSQQCIKKPNHSGLLGHLAGTRKTSGGRWLHKCQLINLVYLGANLKNVPTMLKKFL